MYGGRCRAWKWPAILLRDESDPAGGMATFPPWKHYQLINSIFVVNSCCNELRRRQGRQKRLFGAAADSLSPEISSFVLTSCRNYSLMLWFVKFFLKFIIATPEAQRIDSTNLPQNTTCTGILLYGLQGSWNGSISRVECSIDYLFSAFGMRDTLSYLIYWPGITSLPVQSTFRCLKSQWKGPRVPSIIALQSLFIHIYLMEKETALDWDLTRSRGDLRRKVLCKMLKLVSRHPKHFSVWSSREC